MIKKFIKWVKHLFCGCPNKKKDKELFSNWKRNHPNETNTIL